MVGGNEYAENKNDTTAERLCVGKSCDDRENLISSNAGPDSERASD